VFSAYEDDGVTLHELANGDTVQLQICKKYGTPLKTYAKVKQDSSATTEDDYTIEIPSVDTDAVESTKDMKFGDYYYDVSIITADGLVCTYIGYDEKNSPKFTILNEAGERREA
jgi:hypothetical protein